MERLKRAGGWLIKQRWWWPLASLSVMALIINFPKTSTRHDIRAPQYLKALKILAPDSPAHFDDFELHTGPSPIPPELYVDDQSVDVLAKSRYRRRIEAGELLRWADLEEVKALRQIPPGHRAYVISPENPWLARGGDHIDILMRPTQRGEEPLVLAENVLVLERLGRGSKGEVVVAVRQRDLELLEKAKQQGKLSIAILGKADFASARSSSSPRHRRANRRVRPIEIITGAE